MIFFAMRKKKAIGKRLLFFLIGLFIIAGTCFAAIAQSNPENPDNIILIGWDGLERDNLLELLKNGQLPNLEKIISEGSLVFTEVSTGRTETKPGWAEILTGYNASRLGVIDNVEYKPIPTGWSIFERLKASMGENKIKTIFIGGKINNIGSRGVHEICINCLRRDPLTKEKTFWWDKQRCVAKTRDGGPYRWVLREGEPYFNSKDSIDLHLIGLGEAKNVCQQALVALEKYQKDPFFAFIHFEEPDEQGHIYGRSSDGYAKAVKANDYWLGIIIEKLKSLGIYGNTVIYLTSDHGFDKEGFAHGNAPNMFLATNSKRKLKSGDRKDIAPTLLEEYGIDLNDLAPPLDGNSLFIEKKKGLAAYERRLDRKKTVRRWKERIKSIINLGELPIIDTEITYDKKIDVGELIKLMDELNVALVALAPKFTDPAIGSQESLELFHKYPDHLVPTTCDGSGKYWSGQESSFMDKIEEEVKSEKFWFMGEYQIRKYMSARQYKRKESWRVSFVNPGSPWARRLFKISSQNKITLQIHCEPDDDILKPLEKMIADYPTASVIWCHLGAKKYPKKQSIYSPAYIDYLLGKYRNLYFDLAVSTLGSIYPGSGELINTIQDLDGALKKDWRVVIEKYPSRFTIGSDYSSDKLGLFPDLIKQARVILSNLSDPTAERIAYKNAWYLITGDEWSDE